MRSHCTGETVTCWSHAPAGPEDGGKLKLSYPDGKSVKVVLKAGETLWIPAETHAAENVGATDAHSLVVELKESSRKR